MKTKKLILSLFAFTMLAVSACSTDKSNSSSSVDSGTNNNPTNNEPAPSTPTTDPTTDPSSGGQTVTPPVDDHTTPITNGYAIHVGTKYYSLNTGSPEYLTQDGAWSLTSVKVSTGEAFQFTVDGVAIPVKSDGNSTHNNIIETHPYDDPLETVHVKIGGTIGVYLKHWSDSNEYTFWLTGAEGEEESGEQGGPTLSGYFIRSSQNSWGTPEEARLTAHDPDIGYIRYTFTPNEEFQIGDVGWEHYWGYYWDHGSGDAKNIFGDADHFVIDTDKQPGDTGYGNIVYDGTEEATYDIYLNSDNEIWVFHYEAPVAKTYYACVGDQEVELEPMEGNAPAGFVAQYSGEYTYNPSGTDPDMSFKLYYKLENDATTKHYINATPSGSDTEHNVYNNYVLADNVGSIRQGGTSTIYLKVSSTEYYECFVTGGPELPSLTNGYYFLTNDLNNFDIYSGIKLGLKPGSETEYTFLNNLNEETPIDLVTNTAFQIVYYDNGEMTWYGSEVAKYGQGDNLSAFGQHYIVPKEGTTDSLVVVPGAYSFYFETAQGDNFGLWVVRESNNNGLFLYGEDPLDPGNYLLVDAENVELKYDTQYEHYQHEVAPVHIDNTVYDVNLKFKVGSTAADYGVAGVDVVLDDSYKAVFNLNDAKDTLSSKDDIKGTAHIFFTYEVKGIVAEVTMYVQFVETRVVYLPNSTTDPEFDVNKAPTLNVSMEDDNHYYYEANLESGYKFKIYDSNIEGEEIAKWISNSAAGDNYTLDDYGNMVISKDGHYYINYYVESDGNHISVYRQPESLEIKLDLTGFSDTEEKVYAWVWGGEFGTAAKPSIVPVTKDGDDLILAIDDSATGFLLLKTVGAIDPENYNKFPTDIDKVSSDIETIRNDYPLVCKGLNPNETGKYLFDYNLPAPTSFYVVGTDNDWDYGSGTEYKLTVDPSDSNHYTIELDLTAANDGRLKIKDDLGNYYGGVNDGDVNVGTDGTYIVNFYYSLSNPGDVHVTIEPIYYLVGTLNGVNGWDDNTKWIRFEKNPDNSAEYVARNVELKTNDEFKARSSLTGNPYTPASGGNYVFNGSNGTHDIYFRTSPYADWYNGYFWVA